MRDESTKELREAFEEFAFERGFWSRTVKADQIPGIILDFKNWCKSYNFLDLLDMGPETWEEDEEGEKK